MWYWLWGINESWRQKSNGLRLGQRTEKQQLKISMDKEEFHLFQKVVTRHLMCQSEWSGKKKKLMKNWKKGNYCLCQIFEDGARLPKWPYWHLVQLIVWCGYALCIATYWIASVGSFHTKPAVPLQPQPKKPPDRSKYSVDAKSCSLGAYWEWQKQTLTINREADL